MIDLCLLTQKNQTLKGVIGRNIALWQNLWVGVGRFERRSSSTRASLALCGRFNQFRSPYSWITMRRALRKRHVFDFVPSYLNQHAHLAFPPEKLRLKIDKKCATKRMCRCRPFFGGGGGVGLTNFCFDASVLLQLYYRCDNVCQRIVSWLNHVWSPSFPVRRPVHLRVHTLWLGSVSVKPSW